MSQDLQPNARSGTPCEGWWEEVGYGRQPMLNLQLRFQGNGISGSGIDIIGPFFLQGRIAQGGGVAMVKQYLGQHSVDYAGTYDGEGTMWGQWRIGPFHDRWMIKIARPATSRAAVSDDAVVMD